MGAILISKVKGLANTGSHIGMRCNCAYSHTPYKRLKSPLFSTYRCTITFLKPYVNVCKHVYQAQHHQYSNEVFLARCSILEFVQHDAASCQTVCPHLLRPINFTFPLGPEARKRKRQQFERSHQHGQPVQGARRHADVDPLRSADTHERSVVNDNVDLHLRCETQRR